MTIRDAMIPVPDPAPEFDFQHFLETGNRKFGIGSTVGIRYKLQYFCLN